MPHTCPSSFALNRRGTRVGTAGGWDHYRAKHRRPSEISPLMAEKPNFLGSPVRLLVVEDVALYREALVRLLRRVKQFRLLGIAARPETAVAMARKMSPDAVVLDLRMAQSIPTCISILQVAPDAKMVSIGVQEAEE